jgi:hypothetical protein
VTGDTYSAQMTICARTHDKMISARAARLIIEDHQRRPVGIAEADDVKVPADFWWARGEQALTQNWSTGDFETWIKERVHYKAYGVKFLRSDIMSMVPPDALKRTADTQAKRGKKIFIGHGRSLVWRELKDHIVVATVRSASRAFPRRGHLNCPHAEDQNLPQRNNTYAPACVSLFTIIDRGRPPRTLARRILCD